MAFRSPHSHLFPKQKPCFLCFSPQEKYSRPGHPGGLLLTLLQFVNVLLALGGVKTGEKIQSYLCRVQEYNHCPQTTGCAPVNTAQGTDGLFFRSGHAADPCSACYLPRPRRSFSATLLPSQSVSSLYSCRGLVCSRYRTFSRNTPQILSFNLREQKSGKQQQVEINSRQHAARTGSQDEEFNQINIS